MNIGLTSVVVAEDSCLAPTSLFREQGAGEQEEITTVELAPWHEGKIIAGMIANIITAGYTAENLENYVYGRYYSKDLDGFLGGFSQEVRYQIVMHAFLQLQEVPEDISNEFVFWLLKISMGDSSRNTWDRFFRYFSRAQLVAKRDWPEDIERKMKRQLDSRIRHVYQLAIPLAKKRTAIVGVIEAKSGEDKTMVFQQSVMVAGYSGLTSIYYPFYSPQDNYFVTSL